MKQLSKKQLLKLCKVRKANHNRIKQQLCKCLCCEDTEEPPLEVFSFGARIGPSACNGRCSGTPFNDITLYTATPLVELPPFIGIFGPSEGAIIYYDEELTIPIIQLEAEEFIRITDCTFADVSEIGEILYVIC